MTDRKRLIQTLVGVYGFFDKELTEFAIRVWTDALAGLPIEAVEAAFTAHLKDPNAGRFLPRPADILRQINGDSEERALIAWGEVISAARSGGGRFDGATQQAIDSMGGMGRIRLAGEHENGFLQRQFVAAFKAYKARDEAPRLVLAEVAKIGRIA